MINKLIKLSDTLDQLGAESKADSVDLMIKESLMGPSPQKIQKIKQETSTSQIHALLDLLGLVPVLGEGADLGNAALYLSEGVTPNNLLMAGLSITSMIPTLGDVSKLIKYGKKLAPEATFKIAELMIINQGKIKATFDRLKDPKNAKRLQAYLPGGKLLTQYSDQIWDAVRNWTHKIIDNKAKQKAQEESSTKPTSSKDLKE